MPCFHPCGPQFEPSKGDLSVSVLCPKNLLGGVPYSCHVGDQCTARPAVQPLLIKPGFPGSNPRWVGHLLTPSNPTSLSKHLSVWALPACPKWVSIHCSSAALWAQRETALSLWPRPASPRNRLFPASRSGPRRLLRWKSCGPTEGSPKGTGSTVHTARSLVRGTLTRQTAEGGL